MHAPQSAAPQPNLVPVIFSVSRNTHSSGVSGVTSTVRFDPSDPMISLDLSRVTGSDDLLALVMTCASAWMESALLDPTAGQRWVVYDEAWRIMQQPSLLARMQAQWKLSRAYGLANLMIIHRLSDLDAVGDASSHARALASGLLADCSTRIVYRQEADQLAGTRTALGLTVTERELLGDLGLGEGLWHIGKRGFVVQHQMTADELALFDTTARMTRFGRTGAADCTSRVATCSDRTSDDAGGPRCQHTRPDRDTPHPATSC